MAETYLELDFNDKFFVYKTNSDTSDILEVTFRHKIEGYKLIYSFNPENIDLEIEGSDFKDFSDISGICKTLLDINKGNSSSCNPKDSLELLFDSEKVKEVTSIYGTNFYSEIDKNKKFEKFGSRNIYQQLFKDQL
ncbi:hypothetical protein C0585_02760 [Candidatus Woesearchaeota archaeon]|nr:MAG: hypothetical protein C0585_02760 [Candidatus Woesearchaeota archaeon]